MYQLLSEHWVINGVDFFCRFICYDDYEHCIILLGLGHTDSLVYVTRWLTGP